MFGGCKKCKTTSSILLLAIGILFLLVDLGVWGFWNIQWYTALILLLGIIGIAKGTCKDCHVAESKK